MPGEKFYFLGTIRKTYGINGEVVIDFRYHPTETNLKNLESVFIEIDGQRIPFFISVIRKLSPESASIKFDLVDKPDDAKSLIHCNVYTNLRGFAPRETEEMDLSILVGFTLFGIREGEIGKIDEVLIYPMNSVLKILSKGEEILIPFDEELIESVDVNRKRIDMNLPEGLID
jgi:16S rRNA processing protein RimM